MKIYTKGGDSGETSLVGGTRVKKDHPLLDAYGTVDELNAVIGLLLTEGASTELEKIQNQLCTIAGMLATEPSAWEKYWKTNELSVWISEMETTIDKMSENLSPLNNFILPRGNRAITMTHIARTICRRAERNIVRIVNENTAYILLLQYANRLSDFFFIYARYLHKTKEIEEKYWKPNK